MHSPSDGADGFFSEEIDVPPVRAWLSSSSYQLSQDEDDQVWAIDVDPSLEAGCQNGGSAPVVLPQRQLFFCVQRTAFRRRERGEHVELSNNRTKQRERRNRTGVKLCSRRRDDGRQMGRQGER